jgi:hypothetical protein
MSEKNPATACSERDPAPIVYASQLLEWERGHNGGDSDVKKLWQIVQDERARMKQISETRARFAKLIKERDALDLSDEEYGGGPPTVGDLKTDRRWSGRYVAFCTGATRMESEIDGNALVLTNELGRYVVKVRQLTAEHERSVWILARVDGIGKDRTSAFTKMTAVALYNNQTTLVVQNAKAAR